MSKTLTVEEFYNKWFYENQETYVNTKFKELMPMFAEAYHKAKVESVTDDEIEKITNTKYNGFFVNYRKPFLNGAKWLKQKLLEQ